jgi:hypothetical protein
MKQLMALYIISYIVPRRKRGCYPTMKTYNMLSNNHVFLNNGTRCNLKHDIQNRLSRNTCGLGMTISWPLEQMKMELKDFNFNVLNLKILKLSINLEPNPRTISNKGIKLTPP